VRRVERDDFPLGGVEAEVGWPRSKARDPGNAIADAGKSGKKREPAASSLNFDLLYVWLIIGE